MVEKPRVLVVAVSALVCMAAPALSFDFECTEFRPLVSSRDLERPDVPYCVSSFGPFLDSFDFDRCRSDVENYRAIVEKYMRCLDAERREAVEEFNEAVRAFNSRASL